MNPDQTALGSCLIWVHIVCITGSQSTSIDDQADKAGKGPGISE